VTNHMTLDEINTEIAALPSSPTEPEHILALAALVQRRIELEQEQRKSEDAAAFRAREESTRGSLIAFVPHRFTATHFMFCGHGRKYDCGNGNIVHGAETVPVEIIDGRRAIRLRHLGDYKTLAAADPSQSWSAANPHLQQALNGITPRVVAADIPMPPTR
jgi:hypothetical protein